ncbi:MAG: DUF4313 domain-containing protein [Bacteroidales bacterium]|nr:DUF4313 domain-containing protein [Bacteroidales bacterium]
MKYYSYKGTKVRLQAEEYRSNGTLAVAMYTKDGNLYDVITVNLCDGLQSDSMAFLDTNNHSGIDKWMEKQNLAIPMYVTRRSGFCTYPLYTILTSNF